MPVSASEIFAFNTSHLGAPADALALVAASREDRITVPQIATQLRKWATA
jgi:hypothetical protein